MELPRLTEVFGELPHKLVHEISFYLFEDYWNYLYEQGLSLGENPPQEIEDTEGLFAIHQCGGAWPFCGLCPSYTLISLVVYHCEITKLSFY